MWYMCHTCVYTCTTHSCTPCMGQCERIQSKNRRLCFGRFLVWGGNVLRSQDSWFGLGFRVRVQNMASVKKVDLFLTVIKILLFFDWNFWWVNSHRMVFQQRSSSSIVVNGCSMNHCTTPQQPHMVYIPA